MMATLLIGATDIRFRDAADRHPGEGARGSARFRG